MRRRVLVTATAILLVALLAAYLPPRTRPSLRSFDADHVAALELGMWQAYYAKQRVRLFGLLVLMLREQFHFSWANAATTGFHLARAAARFGDMRSNYETVLPDLNTAYRTILAHSDGTFRPDEVARAELAWWVARRIPGSDAPEQVGHLIAKEYAEFYTAPLTDMESPGFLRAKAAALRDAQAAQPDWLTIGSLLRDSYRTLRARLASPPAGQPG